jgi:hypothetical protein
MKKPKRRLTMKELKAMAKQIPPMYGPDAPFSKYPSNTPILDSLKKKARRAT